MTDWASTALEVQIHSQLTAYYKWMQHGYKLELFGIIYYII